jgi:hypothetical protein
MPTESDWYHNRNDAQIKEKAGDTDPYKANGDTVYHPPNWLWQLLDIGFGLIPGFGLVRDFQSDNPVKTINWILDTVAAVTPFIPYVGIPGDALKAGV